MTCSGTTSSNNRTELFVEMGYDRAVVSADNYKYLRAAQGEYANSEVKYVRSLPYAHVC